MKKILAFAIMLLMAAGGIDAQQTRSESTMVYICTGKASKRYHRTDECRGLDSCTGTIQLVAIEKARKLGRTPCRICYK